MPVGDGEPLAVRVKGLITGPDAERAAEETVVFGPFASPPPGCPAVRLSSAATALFAASFRLGNWFDWACA